MTRRELERLTQGMADGTLSEEEVFTLEDELQSNPSSREFYRRSMRIELLLGEALKLRALPAPQLRVKTLPPRKERKPRRSVLSFAMRAAAILVVCAIALQLILLRHSESSIQVTFSPGTSWSGPVDKDGRLKFGESVNIGYGTMELNLPNDVHAVIEGPAEIELPHTGLLLLREGSGWFRVGKAGHGFHVRTPHVEVVDLGTEFGLSTRPSEQDLVQVYVGEINCSARFAMKDVQALQEGQALKVSPVGRWIEQAFDAERFLKSLPTQLPGIRFSFDGNDPLKPDGEYPAVKGMKVQTHGGGPAKLAEGVNGKALYLRSRDDAVRTNWPGIGGSAPRTIACWIQPNGSNRNPYAGIISWGNSSEKGLGRCNFMIGKSNKENNRVLRFAVGGSIQFSGSTPIVPDEWQHIALVFRGTGNIDGDMVELYLNGEREQVNPEFSHLPKDDQVIATVIDGAKSQPLQIGCGPFPNTAGGRFFGAIDEISILPRALSASEIKGLMEQSKGGLPAGATLSQNDG